MKRILVPCDFSVSSIQAYKFAMDLANLTMGEVLVLKVLDLPFFYHSSYEVQPFWHDSSLENTLENEYMANYEKLKSMYAEITAPVSFLIERGSVTLTILRIIEEQDIDVVVMGAEGMSETEISSIGAKTAKIVRLSPVPVIVLRRAVDISTIKNIVLPTALELDHSEFLSKVKMLQHLFKARLHVLYINTPSHFHSDDDLHNMMEQFVQHFELKDYTVSIRNDVDEMQGILTYASSLNGGMIVMGTHGRRGTAHMLYGSIAEDVVISASCPVWTSNLME